MLKNKYILGVAFAAMLGFGSCVDLDMEPQGSPEAGEVADERMAFLRLSAVYSDVKSFFYTWSMQCFGDVLSEDATYSGSANDASTFQLMENFQYSADHNEILINTSSLTSASTRPTCLSAIWNRPATKSSRNTTRSR